MVNMEKYLKNAILEFKEILEYIKEGKDNYQIFDNYDATYQEGDYKNIRVQFCDLSGEIETIISIYNKNGEILDRLDIKKYL